MEKKEFSRIPKREVERVYEKFGKKQTSDEDKIKLTRSLLKKIFTSFMGRRIMNPKNKDARWFLLRHVSTRERFDSYLELYEKLLKIFKEKEISVIDLGAGINGLSYKYFPKNKRVNYIGVEAVGQLVDLMNYYFKKNKISKAKARIVFLFKVVDSLEMVERNYSKKFLKEIVPLVDLVVVSFATKSLISKKSFNVKRFWFENFVKENFNLNDDFVLGGERYFIFGRDKFIKSKI